MQKTFVPSEWEEKLYSQWERDGVFTAKVDPKKEPFSIILPPPNANADLHVGHAMYVYEDIMIRYHKLQGKEVLWLPGADHAGFETQYVYEKHLAKQDKSRFDFPRDELYKDIWNFVMQNRETMENQLRKLGFALDWEKKKFTLDEDVVAIVYTTFERMFNEGLIYRDKKLVNYCTHDGTSFSDLEVVYKDETVPLYYMKYGPFELATVRPETKFGDTAVAVHPTDKRYIEYIGKEIEVEGLLGTFTIKVISDEAVDPKFGTGVVKVTPAHDFNDYEMAKRHNLPLKQVIGFDGRLNEHTGPYKGMKVAAARAKVVEDLKAKGLITKVNEAYEHRVPTCYKCGRVIEPLPKEQWFVKVRPLTEKAMEAVEKGEIEVHPKRFKKILYDWLDRFHDWNISRQIVWGIRIPAYQCGSDHSEKGWFVSTEQPKECLKCGKDCGFKQDEDTFDTWFSSSQWPMITLKTQKDKELYDYFYPTTVMETGYDILPVWVTRMIMMGIFVTGKVPFKHVYLHGMVRDKKGLKMSKSKGNVVNPLVMIDKFGADALRATLVFQTTPGGDVSFAEDKIIGMRNFANKIWNIGRLLKMSEEEGKKDESDPSSEDKKALEELNIAHAALEKSVHKSMNSYEFARAFDDLYEFVWHEFADIYIERLKEAVRSGNIKVLEEMKKVFSTDLKLLHPFMPFVTEAIWKELNGEDTSVFD
ncbi:valine--tRNA ligase [Candidatus Woesebacteria bacterium]|nr:valine--tRNA ligase [Candidatus Woesebacteria bacterium]